MPVVAPPVEAATISPTDTGSFDAADLHAIIAARSHNAERADRAERGLYPPPPKHVRGAAVAVAVAPPPTRPVPVATYRPKHAATVKAAHYTKAGNTGSTHYAPPVSHGGVIGSAESYLGVPYVWGGTSRSGIDCSGLVDAAYRAVGISLPRTAAQISTRGVSIPRGSWQAGDILYWGGRGSAYHVAIYVGNGMMIEAAHPGTSVRLVSVWGSPGAVRV